MLLVITTFPRDFLKYLYSTVISYDSLTVLEEGYGLGMTAIDELIYYMKLEVVLVGGMK